MSDDYQWRQLGSIVNEVLMDTRTKAIRNGTQAKVSPRGLPGRTQQRLDGGMRPEGGMPRKLGNGFLNPEYQPAAPAQLELPFGITATQSDFGKPRSPRGVRLT